MLPTGSEETIPIYMQTMHTNSAPHTNSPQIGSHIPIQQSAYNISTVYNGPKGIDELITFLMSESTQHPTLVIY